MAQTLKFGNGTWATKKGSTLAHNDEDGNFKPLPFTTTRSTSATRVNKEGLIEVISNEVPRVDYKDSEDGVFLLEKASTNLITYSEDFSNASWIKTRSSISGNSATSPDGTLNADKLIEDTSTNTHSTQNNVTIGNVDTTISVFVKADTRSRVRFILTDLTTGDYRIDLNLNNLSVIENNGGSRGSWANTSYKIENFTNNWYRVSLTATKGAGSQASLSINLLDNSGNHVYTGDGISGIYVWGAQVESGNLSSYIPTQGASQTRVAETASGSGNSGVFNSEQGILYAEGSLINDDGTPNNITLGDNTFSNNRMMLLFSNGIANRISARFDSSGSDVTLNADGYDLTLNHKVVLKYKANDIAIWVDGFEVNTGNSFSAPSLLNRIDFYNPFDGGQNNFYGKTKELAYYDTVLTNLELETLTSYRTWEAMVKELNLNIIHNE